MLMVAASLAFVPSASACPTLPAYDDVMCQVENAPGTVDGAVATAGGIVDGAISTVSGIADPYTAFVLQEKSTGMGIVHTQLNSVGCDDIGGPACRDYGACPTTSVLFCTQVWSRVWA